MSRFPATQGWQCGAKRIEIQAARPFLLGILNVTPDSFSDGGKFTQVGAAVSHGVKLCEVADGVDVGGESTRPGAVEISAKEERARVIPVLREIRKERPEAFLSVDTYKVEVARAAVEEAGVDVVNDVGGGRWDEGMWEWVAGAGVGYVCMHAGGRPQEMQKSPSYGNVVQEVQDFLQRESVEWKGRALRPIGWCWMWGLDLGNWRSITGRCWREIGRGWVDLCCGDYRENRFWG